MKKTKKIFLGLSSIGVTLAPISVVVSCNPKYEKLVILSGKTQITDQGRAFAKVFEGTEDFKKPKENGGAKGIDFITTGGNKFQTKLTTTFGTSSFPGAYTAANPTLVKEYFDDGGVSVFRDPVYNGQLEPTVDGAEEHNIKIAGPKVNELIKQLARISKSDLMLKDHQGNILGFPTYTEAMGLIYNKGLFQKAGVTININTTGQALSNKDWSDKIYDLNGPVEAKTNVTIDPTKDLLTADKTNELLSHVQTVLRKNGHANITSKGITTKGSESWAFSSKVLLMTSLSAAAENASLKNQGAVMPGGTYASDRLTPDTAQSKLFSKKTDQGIVVAKEAFKFFLTEQKGAKVSKFDRNQELYDNFAAKKVLTIPQGTWVEGTLNETDGLEYGYLPIPVTGAQGKIAYDTAGWWVISDQVNSNGRSSAAAKEYRTQAVNFIYNQYLTDEGAKNLEKSQGLNNPYRKNQYLEESKHPLIVDANKYANIRWGSAFNKPGVGQKGYERNNLQFTKLIQEYDGSSSMDAKLETEILEIWKIKN